MGRTFKCNAGNCLEHAAFFGSEAAPTVPNKPAPYSVETRIQGKGKTMKHKIVLLLAAFLCAGALSPTTTQAAVGFSVQVGDYPYYTHGSYYWRNGVRWHWVPGHWSYRHHHRYWVHGYY